MTIEPTYIVKTEGFSLEEKHSILNYLFGQTCKLKKELTESEKKRIKMQRYRARCEVLYVTNNLINLWDLFFDESNMFGRLGINNLGEAEYKVNTDANAEITNILRRLVNYKATWVN